jgi:hypothetical protein
MSESSVFICHGVQPDFECKFDGACYGEICIDPAWCKLKREDMTTEQRADLRRIREELGMMNEEQTSEEPLQDDLDAYKREREREEESNG